MQLRNPCGVVDSWLVNVILFGRVWSNTVIEIYDISNGKLKYSAYSFWQLCEMVMEDYAYHTSDQDNDITGWIEEKAKRFSTGTKRKEVLKRLERLLEFGENEGHRAFASRMSLLLGEIVFQKGEYESAIECFQKSVSLLPYHVEALHQLARAFSAIGQHEKAAETLRKANGIFPSEEAFLCLAEALEKLKRPKEQEKALRSLLRNYPRSVKGMHVLAEFCRRRGRNKAAARLAQRIIDFYPESGERPVPFFHEFGEALVWAKYNYEARKVNKVLDFLDEEQEANPDERLSLLKAVMLYKLDKRLCREECRHELRKYFEGIAYEKPIVADDLREVVEVLGQEFSRGVVQLIKNQLGKHLQGKESRKPHPVAARISPDSGDSSQRDSDREGQSFRRGANFWDARLPRDFKGFDRTL